ncbi:3,7-dimethylxanthine N-methyltransferase-like [Neltuma alba]|uniref:3,7-dimethylxanthine N-methyltransferase-like n=1 Tax=Neltuma alba TaxID=207710 RepID=UPI0010A33BB1|nr:3,7-dimethylxanthine N-methyltransferase-like [Prosopis alba]
MASKVMAVERVLHMNGGVGETSYANNSLIQRKVLMRVRPILEESIKKMYCTNASTCLKVADLGCSSGPNAFLVASNVIDIVNETSRRLKIETPTFQFFLNDLFGNDFNSIFQSLPEFYYTLKQDTTCLINAMPGTFYGTLFPSNSIHFFHSSYSLHWLSQVPDLLSKEAKLSDDDKGNIYVTSTSPPSYAKQFKEDFTLFLRSRSRELVPGGGMLLAFIGRYDTSQNITAAGLFRMILNDMVLENLIEETKLEHFNVPVYVATADEVKEIIKEEGSFSVERLESIETSWDGSSLDDKGYESFKDDNERGKFVARYLRAVFEPLLKAHFGEGIVEEVFLRFQNKVVQLLPKLVYPTLVISLTKIA